MDDVKNGARDWGTPSYIIASAGLSSPLPAHRKFCPQLHLAIDSARGTAAILDLLLEPPFTPPLITSPPLASSVLSLITTHTTESVAAALRCIELQAAAQSQVRLYRQCRQSSAIHQVWTWTGYYTRKVRSVPSPGQISWISNVQEQKRIIHRRIAVRIQSAMIHSRHHRLRRRQ